MAKIGYQRVSTKQQSTERQLTGLDLDLVFEDKLSGRNKERPQLKAMIQQLRAGDEVFVHDISRLARSLMDLEQIIGDIVGSGAAVSFIKEGLRFDGSDNPMNTMMLQLLGSFAQFNRSLICAAVQEGIDIAKAAGKMKGSKPTIDRRAVADLVSAGRNNFEVAKTLNISVSSIKRIKKELALIKTAAK